MSGHRLPSVFSPSTVSFCALVLAAGWVLLPGSAHGESAKDEVAVTVAPVVTVCQRPGITGGGWVAAYRGSTQTSDRSEVVLIYPYHPDDWGKSVGTGISCSSDGGVTWVAAADNTPIPGMLDMWQDPLPNGRRITFGIRFVPDRAKLVAGKEDPPVERPYVFAISQDKGKTWPAESAQIHCPASMGVIARPLAHIWEEPDGAMYMPGYAWSKTNKCAVLLKSSDHGRNWNVLSTIADTPAARDCGAPFASPWVETVVARTSDGSLLAVMRTGSNSKTPLIAARSTDGGTTWSAVEKVLAGSQRRMVPGKMPGLCLLPNGVLVLVTALSKNHCRVYVSPDGTGRQWSDGFVVTSQSGGNTGSVCVGDDKLLIVTPASERLLAWQVTVAKNRTGDASQAAPPGPANVRAICRGLSTQVAWDAPPGPAKADHYLVTPILVKPPECYSQDMEIYPYAPIATRDAATQLSLDRVLPVGGTYRFEVAAVNRDGRRSAVASSAEVSVGISSKR